MIYLDNAATTKPSKKAINAMLSCSWGNPSSQHSIGFEAKESLDRARFRISKCLNIEPTHLFFTSGGSESDNQAIMSAAYIGEKNNKRHIITSNFEHKAVINTVRHLLDHGFSVTKVKADANGFVNPMDIARSIRKDTCLVTIMYANNEIGTIQPIHEIGKICKEGGVLFHTDAVQAVGNIPLDLEFVDYMSFSGHKFHATKGVGGLVAKAPLHSLIHGGKQESGVRAGTENVPAIVGMAEALEESMCNMEKVLPLRDMLLDGIIEISNVVLNGSIDNRLPNNLNIWFRGIDSESLLYWLNFMGVCASAGSACSIGSSDGSSLLAIDGVNQERARQSVRFSLSYDNTESEIIEAIKIIKKCVKILDK